MDGWEQANYKQREVLLHPSITAVIVLAILVTAFFDDWF